MLLTRAKHIANLWHNEKKKKINVRGSDIGIISYYYPVRPTQKYINDWSANKRMH